MRIDGRNCPVSYITPVPPWYDRSEAKQSMSGVNPEIIRGVALSTRNLGNILTTDAKVREYIASVLSNGYRVPSDVLPYAIEEVIVEIPRVCAAMRSGVVRGLTKALTHEMVERDPPSAF